MIIGFWKRFLSDILDAIILGLVGFALIFPLKLALGNLTTHAVWIGLIISFLYNGLLQCSLGEGQSLAKKLLKIQVARLNGEYLSLPLSFLRYSVIAFIAYNGVFGSLLMALFPDSMVLQSVFVCFVIILFLGCIVMVPIHPLKRGIHDLISGSIVIKKGTYDPSLLEEEKKHPNRLGWAYGAWIASSLVVLVLGGMQWAKLMNNPDFKFQEMVEVQKAILADTAYEDVGVSENYSTFRTTAEPGKTTKSLVIKGFLNGSIYNDPAAKQKELEKAVELAKSHFKDLKEVDQIVIVSETGFDIGIANLNKNDKKIFDTNGQEIDK